LQGDWGLGKHWRLRNNGCTLSARFVANYTTINSLGKAGCAGDSPKGGNFCFSLVPNVFSWGSQRVHRVPKLFQNLGTDLFIFFEWGPKRCFYSGVPTWPFPQKKVWEILFYFFRVRCTTIENWMQWNSEAAMRWNWTLNKQVINHYGRQINSKVKFVLPM
jgi:hypothetical protein